MVDFDDNTIRELFGTDAAEDDDPKRLRAYFFRNRSYQNIRANLPLRILVGHKGIGKSALLRMSHLEDEEAGILSINVQPNNLIIKQGSNLAFIEKIDEYRRLVLAAISRKALEKMSIFDDSGRLGAAELSAKSMLAAVISRAASAIGVDAPQEAARLRKSFLGNSVIRVYIDDLDRGWSASKEDINNISALINAARDLTNEDPRLQIRIGLRSDAYYLYRTSDESTDKVEGNVVRLSWDRHDIMTVMALRVGNFFGRSFDVDEFSRRSQAQIASELHPIIEEKFSVGRGHWDRAPIHIVLLSLNRNRPRDLIKLLTEAARQAYRRNHRKILSGDLESVFSDYSHGRITDLILEFKSEMPNIEKLLYNMKPTEAQMKTREKRWLYSNDELLRKITNIMQRQPLSLANSTVPLSNRAIAEFLYKIDFVLARSDGPDGRPKWTHFDQNRMLQSQFVDFGYKWEVHPAYRWALQPKSVHEILETIQP